MHTATNSPLPSTSEHVLFDGALRYVLNGVVWLSSWRVRNVTTCTLRASDEAPGAPDQLDAALQRITDLVREHVGAAENDKELTRLMKQIRELVDLGPPHNTTDARGGGGACDEVRGFLQDVLGFLSPVRDAFVELATRAGSRVLVKTVRAQDLSATLNDSMSPKLVQQGRTTIKANDFPAAAVREAFRLLNNVFFSLPANIMHTQHILLQYQYRIRVPRYTCTRVRCTGTQGTHAVYHCTVHPQ